MSNSRKIYLVNALLFLAYSGYGGVLHLTQYSPHLSAGLFLIALAIAIHFVTSFLLGLLLYILDYREAGKAWAAVAGIVVLIGFSTCYGIASL